MKIFFMEFKMIKHTLFLYKVKHGTSKNRSELSGDPGWRGPSDRSSTVLSSFPIRLYNYNYYPFNFSATRLVITEVKLQVIFFRMVEIFALSLCLIFSFLAVDTMMYLVWYEDFQ